MSYLVCEYCKHLIAIKWHTSFEGEPLRDCGIEKLMYAIAGDDFKETCPKFEPKEVGHVRQRTLENILEDYVIKLQIGYSRRDFGVGHFDNVDVKEMIKQCANEIRDLMRKEDSDD